MNRRLLSGWVLLLAGVALSAPLYSEAIGRFSGAPVRLRPWMMMTSGLVAGMHVLALGLIAKGSEHRRMAGVMFGLSALAAAAHPVATFIFGQGPHLYLSRELEVLTVLVFAPLVLRDLAWIAMLGTRHGWIGVFVVADLVVTAIEWSATPVAVMARPHAVVGLSPWILPFVVGGIIFVVQERTAEVRSTY